MDPFSKVRSVQIVTFQTSHSKYYGTCSIKYVLYQRTTFHDTHGPVVELFVPINLRLDENLALPVGQGLGVVTLLVGTHSLQCVCEDL